VWSISFAGMVSTPKKTVKPCHCYRTNPKSSLKYNTISSEHPLELAQDLSKQYVTLKPPQKRQIANSVFSNLELNGISLCAEYRLPFAILAKNANGPVKGG
ncbi:MAG: hypothetical protein OEV87_10995, partial [Phycisphaerae bacterium]|nr:hypothetical protein [Phycisphaerae bacterium]